MMKATLVVFLAVAVIAVNAGCEWDGVEYQTGAKWTMSGQCTQATCWEDGGITAKPCGVIRVGAGWELTKEDLSKPYPACCPRPVKSA